ncbi:MAG: Modulator of FtsH protease HflK [candidate division BRC1 bacterium ADurb.BinA292]|nr:MAG: Modulator of FtsH protease HflK [candidate division BRC1 bacterium ADurb.BinA292]
MARVVRINRIVLPKGVGPLIAGLFGAIVLIIVVMSSIYTVQAEELGVVLRFGKFVRMTEPGLRFKLPLGIERVELVPVNRQMKEEFGFRTAHVDVRTDYRPGNYADESLMVTGDRNTVVVEWIVQYRINEPKAFLFNVRNPVDTLRYASEAVMREVVGDRTVDEVLTIGREEVQRVAQDRLQELLNDYQMGLGIEQVALQDVNPPGPVQDSFNEVNQAQQERERMINEAWAEYNREVPRAHGEADQLISEARGYATQRVNEAEGDAARFTALFREYVEAPEVTRQRIFLETMGRLLPRLGRKIILDDAAGQILPLLQLDSPPAREEGGAQ